MYCGQILYIFFTYTYRNRQQCSKWENAGTKGRLVVDKTMLPCGYIAGIQLRSSVRSLCDEG